MPYQSVFQSLPVELRLEIYNHVLALDADEFWNPWLPLLLVNRRVHAELKDILHYASLTLDIPIDNVVQALGSFNSFSLPNYDREVDHEGIKVRQDFLSYCRRFATMRLTFDGRVPLDKHEMFVIWETQRWLASIMATNAEYDCIA
jgi:hypothetical protein